MGYPTIGFMLILMTNSNYNDLKNQKIVESLLKEMSINSGLRQADVAIALGVQQSMVSKYEVGERRLDILEIRRLCQLFKISLEDFIKLLEMRLKENDETD